MSSKAGITRSKKKVTRKGSTSRKKTRFAEPYDAKRFAGTVAAFAHVTAEEMKQWRDDG